MRKIRLNDKETNIKKNTSYDLVRGRERERERENKSKKIEFSKVFWLDEGQSLVIFMYLYNNRDIIASDVHIST